jgi:hypothetical protein
VEGILQLNLLATDFFREKAWPSFLYYNPHSTSKTVSIPIEPGKKTDLYNSITGKFIARDLSSTGQVTIPQQNAAVIVCVPSGAKLSYEGNKMFADGIVVDYKYHGKPQQ